jgi:uncharacterized protein (TIGR02271 family)
MPTTQEITSWKGRTAVDRDGDKIGTIEDVYLDRRSGEPEWVAIKTGLFGSNVSFVPIADASPAGDDIRVGFEKDRVKDAPNVEADGELSPEEERRLYEHYDRDYGDWDESSEDRTEGLLGRDADRERGTGTVDRDGDADGTVGRDVSGPTTDDAMTRSEEHLQVGTTSQEAGRARLRKYVTTEEQTVTVPVQKEKAVLEREPITDANVGDAVSGAPLSDEEHEVVLSEERVVVDKEATPVERVRLGTETVTDQETVTEEVRKEHIETDGDVAGDLNDGGTHDRDRDRR